MKKFLTFLVAAAGLYALEFQPLGYKAIGMGGAGVANASGSTAAYYNPALLAHHNYTVEASLSLGLGGREINLIDPIDKLANEYKLTETIDVIVDNAPYSGSNKNSEYRADLKIQGALSELYKLSQGNGVSIEPTAAFAFQIKNFGIGVYALGEIDASAIIDRGRLSLIFYDEETNGYYYYDPKTDTYGATTQDVYEKYSLEYALDNNLTYIQVQGVGLYEVPLTYAQAFEVQNVNLSIGGSLKYIQGITYKNAIKIDSDDNELEDSLNDNKHTSTSFGVDLGVLLTADKIRVGLVGKYLNSPKLKFYDGSKYTIKPMWRGGVSVDLFKQLTFALDIDLTRNSTGIVDFKSQYIGGGVNFHPTSWFSLRAGLMRNMLQDEEGMIYTAGVGLGFKQLQLDIAAQASSKSGTYDGTDIPRYFKVNIALLSRWGGAN